MDGNTTPFTKDDHIVFSRFFFKAHKAICFINVILYLNHLLPRFRLVLFLLGCYFSRAAGCRALDSSTDMGSVKNNLLYWGKRMYCYRLD